MPKNVTAIFMISALWTALQLTSPHISGAVEDTIIAIVNDDVITLKDLKDFMDTAILQLRMENSKPQDLEQRILELENTAVEKLIEEKLILTAAKEKGVEVNPIAVDERLTEIKGRYPTEQAFLNALLADGATVTDLRDKIAAQLKIKFLVDEEVRSKVVVNPQDITDYYHRNISLFQKPEQLELESLMVPLGQDPAAAQQKGKEALAKIKGGDGLAQVAKDLGLTSTQGTFAKGELQESIEQVIFKLAAGETSPLLKTDAGFGIFVVKNKWPAQVTPLEEVKDKIQDILLRQKFQQSFSSWISQLKEKAFVEIKG